MNYDLWDVRMFPFCSITAGMLPNLLVTSASVLYVTCLVYRLHQYPPVHHRLSSVEQFGYRPVIILPTQTTDHNHLQCTSTKALDTKCLRRNTARIVAMSSCQNSNNYPSHPLRLAYFILVLVHAFTTFYGRYRDRDIHMLIAGGIDRRGGPLIRCKRSS